MGCSTSRGTLCTVSSKNVSIHGIQSTPTKTGTHEVTRCLENRIVVWLREPISDMFENKIEYLRKRVYGLQVYTNVQTCLTFLENINEEKIFLIISNRSQSLEDFHRFSQIEKIYLVNSSSTVLNDKKYLIAKYVLIKNVDTLYKELQEDIDLCEMDLLRMTVSFPSPSQDTVFAVNLAKYEASFLFEQMVKEIIYRLKFESGSKDVFIDFCETHYKNTDNELLVIEDFAKNYRPNQALRWLTSSCFISKIINRVLRTFEIDVIYKLGFFIKQVHIQLTRLYEENISAMKQIAVVYRGKTMPNDEFDILIRKNLNGFLAFTSFLIATADKNASIDFVNRRLELHRDVTGVIFQIDINDAIFDAKTPFALLKDADMNKDEVCFHLGAIFRIESVEPMAPLNLSGIWLVNLKLVHDDNQQLAPIIATACSDEVHANPLSFLGKLLVDMGEHHRAEQVLCEILQDASVRSQPRRLARTHMGLGDLYTFTKDYVKALDHYEQALQTSLIYFPLDHPDLAVFYKSIADNYVNQKNYNRAIENYEKIIELLRNDTQKNQSEYMSDIYNRINEVKQVIADEK
ncbi:unnamed protein product [Adineta ricciae]|uniref:Uncharacterized protein n=1 Tax=Adineta ricciae TaxID=249248 RepID=A0A815CZ59_ADIRI|nr:unnamed protein product [Adineta ricciae]